MLKRAARSLLYLLGLQAGRAQDGLLIQRRTRSDRPLFEPKFDARAAELAISDVRERWPGHDVVALTDEYLGEARLSATRIRCGQDGIETIGLLPLDRTIFVYACDSDTVGLPYLREIIKRKARFYPVQVYRPSLYANVNDRARKILESEYLRQRKAGFDKFETYGVGDFQNIIQAIEETSGLKGDYLEIGCFQGSSSCVATRYMQETGIARNCYFLDVFEGFNYAAAKESADSAWYGTHATAGLDIVRERITRYADPIAGLTVSVIRNNIIEDPLPPEIGDVVVANIDVDLYEAVRAGLSKVAPKIVSGGIMIVEDPGHTPSLIGSRLALEDFLASPEASPFLAVYMESGQTFLIKTSAREVASPSVGAEYVARPIR